jgi:hypothetical protein
MPLTEKIKEHLKRCEYAMQSAKPILGKPHFPTDNRNLTVIGFISMLIEHQESLLVLVMHEKIGSAFALARPIVEGAYRGMWFNLPATDDELKKFNEKDKIDLELGEIATALDGAYGTADFFQDLKTRSWKALNSYTHGGMLQIGRRYTKNELVNNYSDTEVYEICSAVTTVVLVIISVFLKKHGHGDLGLQIDKLAETYGPLADGPKINAK